ncbi:hypothetical protein [Hydrogenimonas sp.]
MKRPELSPLLELIAQKAPPEEVGRLQAGVLGMICNESQPMPLGVEALMEALEREGEFLLLTLDYDQLEEAFAHHRLDREILSALSILVSFEIDTEERKIEEYLHLFHRRLDEKQNFRFGIRRVAALSPTPVRILFSGILPFNRLDLHLGADIHRLVTQNRERFEPRFRAIRERVSETVGAPFLPLYTTLDENLRPHEARLVDPDDGRLLCRIEMERLDDDAVELYARKLAHACETLGREWRHRHEEKNRL